MSAKENKNINKEKKSFFSLSKKSKTLSSKRQNKRIKDKYSGKPLLAINIGSKNIKIVVGKYRNNLIELDDIQVIYGIEGLSTNGRINNAFEIKSKLEGAIRKFDIKVKDVVCTVESSEIIEREIIIPTVPDEDIIGLVKYEMGQYLPIDMHSYVIQCKKIENFIDEGVDKLKVMVAAVPKGILELQIEAFNSVGLDTRIIDITSNSLEKLIQLDMSVSSASPFEGKNVVMLDMGHSTFNLYFFENGQYQFGRIIDTGGRMIDEMISQTMGLGRDEAEKVKLDNDGLISVTELSNKFETFKNRFSEIKVEDGKVLVGTIAIIDTWLDEIDRVFKFFTTRTRDNAIDELFIFGGSANFREIDKYLERKLNIKTSKLSSLESIDIKRNKSDTEALNSLGLIGALVRY